MFKRGTPVVSASSDVKKRAIPAMLLCCPRRLKLFWRTIATALGFLLFGLGSLELVLFVCPCIVVFSKCRNQRSRNIQRAISFHFKVFLVMIQWMEIMRVELHGLEKMADDKGVLIIANHPTLIDIVVMMAYLPEVDCVVKERLWKNPLLRWIVLTAGYIKNSAEPEVLFERCCDRLSQGRNLIVFPEGTRTIVGKYPVFQRGGARIALKACCSLRFIYLSCTPATLSKKHKWYDIPDRPFTYCLRVGRALDTTPWQEPNLRPSIGSRQLTDYISIHYLEEMRVHEITETGT